jgi:dipeptidyl aminopeptidase/acylaminoacyl peptidase
MTAVAAAVGIIGCSAGPEQREIKKYSIEQFYDTESVGGASFSPDESNVLYSSDKSGVFNAYTVSASGGAATQLTDSRDTTFAVSYFPNDGRVLMRRDDGGNEIHHIFLREEDGTERDLTPGEKSRAMFWGWSHDLKSFFFQSNKRDPKAMDLYEMDIENFQEKLLYKNEGGYSLSLISNDKRLLLLDKTRTDHDNNLYLHDLGTGETKHLTPHEGDVSFSGQDFTPDGKGLYYTTNADSEFMYLVNRDLATDAIETVKKPAWDLMYAGLSWNGKYMVAGVNEDAQTRITVTEVATGQEVVLPDLPMGNITGVSFSRSEKKMAFYHTGPKAPANLYVLELESKQHARLTDTMNPEINPDDLVDIEVVRYKSFDGMEIPGLLMKPHIQEGEKVPGLVQVHGGPGGQSRVGYNALMQYLVNHGYAVILVNNRGSSGYGKTFYAADDHRHGQEDLMDCVEAKSYLISTGYVDENKVGIIGGSYGGYMVMAALAFQPEAFDVGVNIFGVTNWVRTLKSIPPWWDAFREALYAELGNPETEEDYLRKISPLFHAENVTKPLIVLQGKNDPRVLQVESDEIVEAVKKNGVPVEYIIFPDEGHGFSKKANRIRGYEAIKVFLDKYLKGEGAEPVSD